jgi:hypothetical protein
MSQPEAVKDNPQHARSAQRQIRFSLKGREVGVAPDMLVRSTEQVSAEAEGAAVHAYTGHAGAVAASPYDQKTDRPDDRPASACSS